MGEDVGAMEAVAETGVARCWCAEEVEGDFVLAAAAAAVAAVVGRRKLFEV